MLSGFIPVKTDVKLISGRGQGKRWNDFWQAAACAYHSICQTKPREIHSSSSQQPSSSARRGMHLPSLETAAWAAACLFEMTHQDSDRSQDCSLKKKKVGHDFFYKSALSICDNLSAGSFWLRVDQLSAGMFGSPCFHYLCMDFPPPLCESPPRFFLFFPPYPAAVQNVENTGKTNKRALTRATR